MSLIICVYVKEGIVLASDSRTCYNKTEGNVNFVGVHSTNTTNKTFLCPNNAGISACGDASIQGKPISGFIEAFIREKIKKETDIEEMPILIKEYFKNLEANLKSTFIIAGYKKEGEKDVQKIYRVRTHMEAIEMVNTSAGQGALWDGEVLTLTKLLTPVYAKNPNTGAFEPMPIPEFAWNYYTLQDAIDFAKYGIKTTMDTMRFQIAIESVGGPIDILIIRPGEAEWLERKELK